MVPRTTARYVTVQLALKMLTIFQPKAKRMKSKKKGQSDEEGQLNNENTQQQGVSSATITRVRRR